MKKNIIKLSILVSLFFILSCASAPKYLYEEDAITLHLKSGENLNLYEDSAHTLLLCVYQLKDPNAFKQLIDEDKGISRLLGCNRFDTGVTGFKRLVIQPDEETVKTMDRAEGTKYIGIVAGYFGMQKEKIFHLQQIPLGFITKNPKRAKINLFLGPQGIQEFRGK